MKREASVLLLKNKYGFFTMCIEYRQLNMFLIKNTYHLPRIDVFLQTPCGELLFIDGFEAEV